MKKRRLIISLILILAVLAGILASCGGTGDPEASTGAGSEGGGEQTSESLGGFTLCYAKADSMNPFFAKSTTNLNLMTLLYDSLYTIGADFAAAPFWRRMLRQKAKRLR